MMEVTIRDLRNHGGDVLDRVQRGENLIVTRSGHPVAELVPLRRPALKATALLTRWRYLPPVNPDGLRSDLDAVVESGL